MYFDECFIEIVYPIKIVYVNLFDHAFSACGLTRI